MDSLLAMGFNPSVAEAAFVKHNGDLDLALDELLLTVSSDAVNTVNNDSNPSNHQVHFVHSPFDYQPLFKHYKFSAKSRCGH